MIIPQLGYGGAETAFVRLAEQMSLSVEVTIAVMANDYGLDSGYSLEEAPTDFPIVVLDKQTQRITSWVGKFVKWCRMISQVAALKRGTDATISFLSGANLINALAAGTGLVVVSERGSKRFDQNGSRLQRWFWTALVDRFVYRRADFIVPASTGLADEIIESNRSVMRKVVPIEGTVKTDKILESCGAQLELGYERFRAFATVVSIGRLHYQKGFDFLITAFSRLKVLQVDARLLIIGDGPALDALVEQATSLGLRVGRDPDPARFDVVFAGYRAMPIRFLQVARLFVMPSRFEGLPNVLIEALGAGVPILAADCPWGPRSILAGEKDTIPDGDVHSPLGLTHGTLLPRIDGPNAQEVWIKALYDALGGDHYPLEFDARRKSIERFDIEQTSKHWLSLIEAGVRARQDARIANRFGISKRLFNRLGRPFGVHPFPRAFEGPFANAQFDAAETFDRIYQENYWGSNESRSGIGSEKEFTRQYCSRLVPVIGKYGFKRFFDAPCGDLNWVADLVQSEKLDYVGGDISDSVIRNAKQQFPSFDLRVFDIISSRFPDADVWHCRDCLFHLPVHAIYQALRNFSESSIPYALITSHRARWLHKNLDVGFGGFRFLDLERPPFSLGRPLLRIPDYRLGVDFPRYVCLWSREQIQSASNHWPKSSHLESQVY